LLDIKLPDIEGTKLLTMINIVNIRGKTLEKRGDVAGDASTLLMFKQSRSEAHTPNLVYMRATFKPGVF
jgi:hypothetical protein